MDAGAISCEGLTRRFPSGTAVADLDLTVGRGEVIALLGPNGAGKTTTVRLLNGVLRPDAGRASVLGLDPWTHGEDVRRRTGVLTEQAGLDERFTALENLVFAASMRGLGGAESERRGRELLARLGMDHRTDTLVRGFSTGERKRVALARALLHEPDLLFLDEPTSGLDPTATREVVDLIGRLASEQGRTVVLCTHFLGEAGELADRMAVLIHGRLHAVGSPTEIASEIWSTRAVDVELAHPAGPELVAAARTVPGVGHAGPSPAGIHLEVTDREVVPVVLSRLVAVDARVYGVSIHEPTLEDVYFAIEDRARRGVADAPTGPPRAASA